MSNFSEVRIRTKEIETAPSLDGCKRLILSIINLLDSKIDTDDLNLFELFTDDGRKLAANADWFISDSKVKDHKATFQVHERNELNIDFKLFGVQNMSKRVISWSQALTPNFEDEPFYEDLRIGIDFIVPRTFDRVLVALSNNYVVRILELHGDLTATYEEIFSKWTAIEDYSNKKYVHTILWESFDLQPINRKFYEGISERFISLRQHLLDHGILDETHASQFANRLIGRLVFCWFIRKKNYINEDLAYFESERYADDSLYYKEKLEVLFFDVLNRPILERSNLDLVTPYLNGGLFEEKPDDLVNDPSLSFPKNYFDVFYNFLNSYNFTTDESTSQFQQVAIDPEMLGRIFENLLAEIIEDSGAQARKAKGAFYTPREIVDFMCRETLRTYLLSIIGTDATIEQRLDQLIDGTDREFQDQDHNWRRDWKPYKEKLINALDELKVLDPACGSGAFPMGMLQLLLRIYERLEPRMNVAEVKLRIVKNNLYGSDIEPMAVEISRLRAWLSLVVDLPLEVKAIDPLPNLDFKFVCANSLLSLEPEHDGINFGVDPDLNQKLANIRSEYFSSSSQIEKSILESSYFELVKASYHSDIDKRTKQLQSFNPFQFFTPADFFDPSEMFGVEYFNIVIGNPPYLGEKGNRQTFEGLRGSSIHRRFYQGRADLLHYFFHLGLDLLKQGGVLSFITTNYFPTATFGSNLRQDLKARAKLLKLVNFQDIKIFESALGQHNMITTLQKTNQNNDYFCDQVVATGKGSITQQQLIQIVSGTSNLALSGKVHSNEIYDGPECYIRFIAGDGISTILSKVAASPQTLGSLVHVNQGIISGIDKFTNGWKSKFPEVKEEIGRSVFVFPAGERKFPHLKPWFKNSDVFKFVTANEARMEILWLGRGYPKPSKSEMDYLRRFYPILSSRSEFLLEKRPWYELHRAREENLFSGPKLVNSYRTFDNAFAYSDSAFFGGADLTYITNYEEEKLDLFFLLGLLNSDLIYTWFYYRGKRKGEMLELKQVPVSEVPITRDAALETLIAEEAKSIYNTLKLNQNNSYDDGIQTINKLVYELYNLTAAEISIIEDFVASKIEIRKSRNLEDSVDQEI
jgi:type I restriction-modification system DNA methylase subunit